MSRTIDQPRTPLVPASVMLGTLIRVAPPLGAPAGFRLCPCNYPTGLAQRRVLRSLGGTCADIRFPAVMPKHSEGSSSRQEQLPIGSANDLGVLGHGA